MYAYWAYRPQCSILVLIAPTQFAFHSKLQICFLWHMIAFYGKYILPSAANILASYFTNSPPTAYPPLIAQNRLPWKIHIAFHDTYISLIWHKLIPMSPHIISSSIFASAGTKCSNIRGTEASIANNRLSWQNISAPMANTYHFLW